MADRIKLYVRRQDGHLVVDDPAAELVGGMAVSHKHWMAFGGIQPVSSLQLLKEGERPPQTGVACLVCLENAEEDLKAAKRQYGWHWTDRAARYIVAGPVGSWVGLLSVTVGLSFGFWPAVHAVSGDGSVAGLLFLAAWSAFYIPVIARAIVSVWHRQWAWALVFGAALYMVVFFLGGGASYVGEGILDIPEVLEKPEA